MCMPFRSWKPADAKNTSVRLEKRLRPVVPLGRNRVGPLPRNQVVPFRRNQGGPITRNPAAIAVYYKKYFQRHAQPGYVTKYQAQTGIKPASVVSNGMWGPSEISGPAYCATTMES